MFKINDVQGRAVGLSDLLNIELRSDSLKMFDQAWEGTLTAMENGLERDHLSTDAKNRLS